MATVPLTYDALTDHVVRDPGPTPSWGPAGSSLIDPLFGCRIWRITDGTPLGGAPANYSYRTPDAPNQMGWTAEGDRFFLKNDQATVFVFAFDRHAVKATFERTVAWGLEPAFPRVTGQRDTMYGVRGIAYHVIERYDVRTSAFTTVLDLKTIDPMLNESVYTNSLYVSGGSVERAVVLYGGTSQDRHMKVTIFDVHAPTTRRTINTQSSTIDGQPLYDEHDAPVVINAPMHSIAVSNDGNTIRLDPINTSAFHWLYDWTANRITKVTEYTQGHYVLGWQRALNEDQGDGPKMQWQWRPLDLTGSHAPTKRITSNQGNVLAYHADHTSWHNASSVENQEAPFFSDCSQGGTAPPRWGYWSSEILAVTATGPETVWRFCHHRMNGYVDNDPNYGTWYYQALLQVDPLGQFVLFNSNWDKTLGTHPHPPQPNACARVDTFLVQLGRAASPPVSKTIKGSGTLETGEAFTMTLEIKGKKTRRGEGDRDDD